LFPNPARSQVTLAFEAPGPGRAEVTVYNTAYQVAAVFQRSIPAAGLHSETWAVDTLAPGVYLFRVTLNTSEGRKMLPVEKLVVLK